MAKPRVCPTVTAFDLAGYSQQIKRISFAKRIHIDLMDGQLAPSTSPNIYDISLPNHHIVDVHLMYQEPMKVLDRLVALKPHMVIVHNEASLHHMHFVAELHKHCIKAGLATKKHPVAPYLNC